ncbi:MAG TPA: polysaccharide deacetylase family protein [Nitrososphaera sp.]|nr:polysaccharide deacetylase family protein [Nitrososphaera sp.]
MFATIVMSVVATAATSAPSAFAQGPAGKTLDKPSNSSHSVVGSALGFLVQKHDDDDGGRSTTTTNNSNMHGSNNNDGEHGDDDNNSNKESDNGGSDRRHHNHHHHNDDSDEDSDNGASNNNDDSVDSNDRGDNNDNNDNNNNNNNSNDNGTRCNCIVMRLDDVQDEWVRDVQLALLNRLISDHVHTSTAIIMDDFGNDSAILSKIREGGEAGLFEYAIHGWDHVDYATLPLNEQKSTLEKAKAKLVDVLGKDSDIFVTPYNNFNENTLNAMDQIGMTIISSDDTDLLPAAPRVSPLYPRVAHMPQTINFADQVGEVKVLRPLDELVSAVRADIYGKGYAVLTLHPQDFTQYNGTQVLNKVNPVAMARLELFIESVRDAGFSFAGFQQALEDDHPILSTIPDKSKPYESVIAPSSGSSFSAGAQIIVSGRAFDDTGVKSVQVRTTNSSYVDVSTDNGFRDWTKTIQMPSAPGTTEIIVKATDITGKQNWIYVPVQVMQQQK